MRWNTSRGHDPRQIDLFAVIALVILIIAGCLYFTHHFTSPPHTTAFIEPSQSVRW
jgi:hypothetical protein